MYQVSLKSEGVRPFFVITWPGITRYCFHIAVGMRMSLGKLGYSHCAITFLSQQAAIALKGELNSNS